MRGFTLIETLIVIGIVVILTGMAILSFSGSKNSKILNITAQDIIFALEEAKSNALSGKGGDSFGIRFTSSGYTTFTGSSYVEGHTSNVTHAVDTNILSLSNTATATNGAIIFTRISGNVSSPATTTISLIENPNEKVEIYIGALGDINVIE